MGVWDWSLAGVHKIKNSPEAKSPAYPCQVNTRYHSMETMISIFFVKTEMGYLIL